MQAIPVERHAYCGVHPQAAEGADFPLRLDAAGGNDRMRRRPPQPLEPFEIGATHSSFAVYIGAEKCGAERFESLHHIFCPNSQCLLPAFDHNLALGGVQRDDDRRAAHSRAELPEEWRVYLAVLEYGASDNDLARAPFRNFRRAANGANSSAHAYSCTKALGRFGA